MLVQVLHELLRPNLLRLRSQSMSAWEGGGNDAILGFLIRQFTCASRGTLLAQAAVTESDSLAHHTHTSTIVGYTSYYPRRITLLKMDEVLLFRSKAIVSDAIHH